MLDRYNRKINYLRISVTDRCNLRCTYCMPPEGVALKKKKENLSIDEFVEIVKEAVPLGFTKIRLTGGEPLLKAGIVELVQKIKALSGVDHLGMTTNGVLLSKYAKPLKAAGLDSVNVSLDTLDPQLYHSITGGGNIEKVLEGINSAIEERFTVKINTVVQDSTTEENILEMKTFCKNKGISLQLINHYSLKKKKLDNYCFDRPPPCEKCNRIRLMADGNLKPCLHSNIEIPVELKNIKSSLVEAVLRKPRRGGICTNRSMIEIGG